MLSEALESAPHSPGFEDLLIPVPLHAARRMERGFDQALRLAASLGDLGMGRVFRALHRTRATVEQGAPGAGGRRSNVRGAFRGQRGLRLDPERPVYLVDDVLTTGATVNACAEALRSMGAQEIHVLAIARA